LEEVKRKVFSELQYSGSGLSGVELASRLKINRMTLTKYLDLMSAKGLIRKKK
jgi:DNA-binding MarR family transcriptional regulator